MSFLNSPPDSTSVTSASGKAADQATGAEGKLARSLLRPGRAAWSSLEGSIRQAPPELRRAALYLLSGAALLLAIIASLRIHSAHQEELARAAELRAGPRVRVARVRRSPAERTVTQVGEALPFASVTLYAKVSGYLRDVRVDKGDRVSKGQTLAVIESPETDKEYKGALADADNKKLIAERMRKLLDRQLVSPQEAEQAITDSNVATARLEAEAVLKDYEILRAPFDGTVTARYADPGALVQNAANAQTSAQAVVTVSQIDRLRVYVYLDQRDAAFVNPGTPVTVTLAERPGFELAATVSRVSGELDPRTKTLLTEIDLDNSHGAIVAGAFVQVALKIRSTSYLEVPAESLVLRQDKSLVPVVSSEGTVHFAEVKVADNDGNDLRVLDGLTEGESVALNLGSSVVEGGHVRVVKEQ